MDCLGLVSVDSAESPDQFFQLLLEAADVDESVLVEPIAEALVVAASDGRDLVETPDPVPLFLAEVRDVSVVNFD